MSLISHKRYCTAVYTIAIGNDSNKKVNIGLGVGVGSALLSCFPVCVSTFFVVHCTLIQTSGCILTASGVTSMSDFNAVCTILKLKWLSGTQEHPCNIRQEPVYYEKPS